MGALNGARPITARISLVTVLLIWLAIVVGVWREPPGNAFAWDSFGYHLYLPAFFERQDPLIKDLQWPEDARVKYNASGTLYQITTLPDGQRVIKYPMGLALLWSPWFALGHMHAAATDAPTDGYARPYQLWVVFGVLIYVLLGLLALRATLLKRFTDGLVAISIALLTLGTNYLDQAVHGTTMPHVMLFSLYAGILLFTMRWHEHHRRRDALILAALMGLATLCRPSEAICVLIPLLWNIPAGFKNAVSSIWRQRNSWLLIAGVMFLIGLPQFLYWKAATGSFFVDAYFNPAEGFDWSRPHTLQFLFSFRKGWYLYTPLMLIATIGILTLRRRWPQAFPAVLAFFLLNLYVVSSWTNWWYADSFSSRAMVGTYAVMALPLAALLEGTLAWRRTVRSAFAALLVLLAGFNLFQQWQFARGIIHSSRMTKAAYIAGFGRTSVPDGLEDMLLVHRSYAGDDAGPDPARYRITRLPDDLVRLPASDQDTVLPDSIFLPRAVRLDKVHPFTPAIRIPFHAITMRDHAWVATEWRIFADSGSVAKASVVMTMEHEGNYGYSTFDAELHPGQWTSVRSMYLTPEVRDADDLLAVYIWLRDTVPVLVSGPQIIVHEPLKSP